jgi:hypothetical protein
MSLDTEFRIQDSTIVLLRIMRAIHFSRSIDGFFNDPSMKLTLFLAVKAIIIEQLQV